MPEGPEVETDRLTEEIQEKLESEGGGFLRAIALTTALFAALAAIAALRAGATVNEALLFKTDATRLQAEASVQLGEQLRDGRSSIQVAPRSPRRSRSTGIVS